MKDTLDGFFGNIEFINIRPRLTGHLAHFDQSQQQAFVVTAPSNTNGLNQPLEAPLLELSNAVLVNH
jgi:hypothetical protein